MSLTSDQLLDFAQRLAADPDNWQQYVRHDSEERTFELIWDDEDVNAWVLCWSEDHDTGFHDHDQSVAAIVALDGQVREDRLRLGGATRERVYGAGESFIVPPNAIHRVLHHGDAPAVTIHAYSPPLTRMGSYSVADDGDLLRQAWDGESAVEVAVAS
jgi:quercetin dioxygenase-like cupin family protein